VTNAAGGAPISGLNVQVFSSLGTFLGGVNTDASGAYSFVGLGVGSYYVRTNAAGAVAGFINQLHSGVVCVGCGIATSGGTLVPVTSGATATVNFALTVGGRISGTVTATSAAPRFRA
jgi:hypothetical protein